MLLKKLIADVEARGGVSKAFQMILGASLLTNVFMAGAFVTMDRTVRTILVPPEINKTFWVDGRSIGPEYLEQMGSWVISQFATVSPATVEFQSNNLLKYVHPSIYGDLAVRFKMGANRIKAENLSKIFTPREVRISEKGQSVAFIGLQTTWIADKRVPGDEMKAYLVTFDYDGSRVYIKELRETSPAKPFDPLNAQSVAEAEAAQAQASAPASQISHPQENVNPATTGALAPLSGLPPAPPGSNAAAQETLQSGNTPINTNSR